MYITPVSEKNIHKNITTEFSGKKYHNKPELSDLDKSIQNDENKNYSKKQVSGYVLATALSAAALAGSIVYGRNGWKISFLESQVSDLTRKSTGLKDSLGKAEDKVKNLTERNQSLEKINKMLTQEVERAKDKLNDIFEGDIAPKEFRDKIFNDLKTKIEKGDYGYDITTPPVTGKNQTKVFKDAIPLPEHVGTQNRAGMKGLYIPEIDKDGRFSIELPMSDEVKIQKMESANFTPVELQMTNISESYADSVNWNNDKISRDIMQNFFDGHGQTLDGVIMKFEPTGNGKYKVRIEGKSLYTPDKAVYIGESSKRDDARAAGNFGEGLKMAVLKLLKDKGSEDVKIASDNWKLTYKLSEGNFSDKRVLSYWLDKTDKYNGNYIEFETADKELLESMRKTINRFYHSNNEHFKCPDFENDILSIKKLPDGEKGGIYIAGQRFELCGDYDGLEGMAINIKEKLPKDFHDPSRDRTSLNDYDMDKIGEWIAKNTSITKDDKVKILKSLDVDDYWDHRTRFWEKKPLNCLLDKLVFYLGFSDVHIKFPEKYVAYSNATIDLVNDLRNKGYKVCLSDYEELGMPTIKDLMGDARAHDVVIPNEVQKKKILILKEAIQKLSPSLKEKHFNTDELNTKIYMFDNKSDKDKKLYSDTLAEAITDKGFSKGFWLDKDYLDKVSFSEVLETALHELSHKAGGDNSAEFSYKLTDVNNLVIGQLLNDIKCRHEFQAMNTFWNSL